MPDQYQCRCCPGGCHCDVCTGDGGTPCCIRAVVAGLGGWFASPCSADDLNDTYDLVWNSEAPIVPTGYTAGNILCEWRSLLFSDLGHGCTCFDYAVLQWYDDGQLRFWFVSADGEYSWEFTAAWAGNYPAETECMGWDEYGLAGGTSPVWPAGASQGCIDALDALDFTGATIKITAFATATEDGVCWVPRLLSCDGCDIEWPDEWSLDFSGVPWTDDDCVSCDEAAAVYIVPYYSPRACGSLYYDPPGDQAWCSMPEIAEDCTASLSVSLAVVCSNDWPIMGDCEGGWLFVAHIRLAMQSTCGDGGTCFLSGTYIGSVAARTPAPESDCVPLDDILDGSNEITLTFSGCDAGAEGCNLCGNDACGNWPATMKIKALL